MGLQEDIQVGVRGLGVGAMHADLTKFPSRISGVVAVDEAIKVGQCWLTELAHIAANDFQIRVEKTKTKTYRTSRRFACLEQGIGILVPRSLVVR